MKGDTIAYIPIHLLNPLDSPAHTQPRPELQQLSDDEMMKAVHFPRDDDLLVINTRTGRLHDGNGRAHELLRRASDPASGIDRDTLVPLEYYTPDYSMFHDLNG